VRRRARPLLGTFVEIGIEDPLETKDAAFDSAFNAIESVHRQMSFHDPQSDLSRLNRFAHEKPRKVHPWLLRVLAEARLLFERSATLFDPSIAPKLVAAGVLPHPDGAPKPDPLANFGNVELTTDGHVFFKTPLWLDLGGIAKGFAVDVAILSLRASGIRQAYVNAGGDLRVFGQKPQVIHLRNPEDPFTYIGIGELANGACATSAGYFGADDSGLWSIVAPQGERLNRQGSITVLAPKCIVADALTKIVALAPKSAIGPLLDSYRAKLIIL
jgi:thiamine biosynthesis lipoprotein